MESERLLGGIEPAALPTVGGDEYNRSVRVFISSTFLDMEVERNELVRKTFPALRSKFRARGVELLEVDLRWGITEEQSERGETLPTVLAEVDHCRPYFIGLLGERYGWIPPPSALTEGLKVAFPFVVNAEGASVTELEIIHGVLRNPAEATQAMFFLRDPSWIDTLPAAGRDTHVSASEEDRAKLETLKARIRSSGARVISYREPAEIGPVVEAELCIALEERFGSTDVPDAFTQELTLHAAYARERRGLHIGAQPYFDRLDKWFADLGVPPILIAGASGSGKSTLIANWLHRWRQAHPKDIIIEHYLDASPDSANPALLMRRIWDHLNRAIAEVVELPKGDAALMDIAAGFAERLALANLTAQRDDRFIVIALDGLDKLANEQNLRWLPNVSWSRIRLLASSLDGEAQKAVVARGWALLNLKPLSHRERRELVMGTLSRWGRSIVEQHVNSILEHRLAGTPLFLKTLLEELRLSATHSRLEERLRFHLNAYDLPDLFGRILERLERDCAPGLVGSALPLIWASRSGLEEVEIISITSATPLAWATLRNGLGDGLVNRAGRVAFSHDFLRQAVEQRYLASNEQKRATHQTIAKCFEAREPDARQAEELPFQLRAAESWERLETLLLDLDRFKLLTARGHSELLSFWLPLKARGRDAEALLCAKYSASPQGPKNWSLENIDLHSELFGAIFDFLAFSGGESKELLHLNQESAAACERIYGNEHPETLTGLSNVALCQHARGDLEGAQSVLEHTFRLRTKVLGPEHEDTIWNMINLARVLRDRGDHSHAQSLQERALEIQTRLLGPEHPHTLIPAFDLSVTLTERGDSTALALGQRVLDTQARILGPDHPDTLKSSMNLAWAHYYCSDLKGTQDQLESVLISTERLLGPEHSLTLRCQTHLASIVFARGDFAKAQELQERVFEMHKLQLGADHPFTLSAMADVIRTQIDRGQHDNAIPLLKRLLKSQIQVLGPEHPDTLTSMTILAAANVRRGSFRKAQRLYEAVLKKQSHSLGPEHPSTLHTESALGGVLFDMGHFKEAKAIYERLVKAHSHDLGHEHPHTLTSISQLASCLEWVGDLVGAQGLYERVLEARTRVLGPEHPDTLNSMTSLAIALSGRGELEMAQGLQECAIEGLVRVLGPEDRSTLIAMSSLARITSGRGDQSRAHALRQQVLDIQTRELGPENPETLASAIEFAHSLRASGNLEGARGLYEQTLDAFTRVLGPKHPTTLTSKQNVGSILFALGDFETAKRVEHEALEVCLRGLGPEHELTLVSMANLGSTLFALGELEAAKELQQRALEAMARGLGPEHSTTRRVADKLADTLAAIENSASASDLQ